MWRSVSEANLASRMRDPVGKERVEVEQELMSFWREESAGLWVMRWMLRVECEVVGQMAM
jgi:hypothetical protein